MQVTDEIREAARQAAREAVAKRYDATPMHGLIAVAVREGRMAAVLVNIMTACRGDGIWVGRNDADTVATIRDAAVGALVRACKADEGIMEADE